MGLFALYDFLQVAYGFAVLAPPCAPEGANDGASAAELNVRPRIVTNPRDSGRQNVLAAAAENVQRARRGSKTLEIV